jgi:predicted nucleotidyltransferase
VVNNDIKKLALKIGQKFKPQKVIVFGSWAWGTPHQDSDVDFCVIKDTDNSQQEALNISRFLYPREYPLDILVYTPDYVEKRLQMGDFFTKKIINEGLILYER